MKSSWSGALTKGSAFAAFFALLAAFGWAFRDEAYKNEACATLYTDTIKNIPPENMHVKFDFENKRCTAVIDLGSLPE